MSVASLANCSVVSDAPLFIACAINCRKRLTSYHAREEMLQDIGGAGARDAPALPDAIHFRCSSFQLRRSSSCLASRSACAAGQHSLQYLRTSGGSEWCVARATVPTLPQRLHCAVGSRGSLSSNSTVVIETLAELRMLLSTRQRRIWLRYRPRLSPRRAIQHATIKLEHPIAEAGKPDNLE